MSTIEQDFCNDAAAQNPKVMELSVDTILFNLFCDIFSAGRPSDEAAGFIKGIVPTSWSFFIIRDRSLVWSSGSCPLTPDEIREMIPPENIGIFTRQISGGTRFHESQGLISAACLGEDRNGGKLAAGLIAPGRRHALAEDEHKAGQLLARIRRCYYDATSSRTLCGFVTRTNAFRYAVDAVTHEIVARRLPEGRNFEAGAELLDRQFGEELLPQILEHDSTARSRIEKDARISNLNIAGCRVLDHEYILLSFRMNPKSGKSSGEFAKVISDFTYRARGKLGAIQTAASQLALQKGRIIDDDDIALASIIRSSVSKLDVMLGCLEQYGHRKATGTMPARSFETAVRSAADSLDRTEIMQNSSGVS